MIQETSEEKLFYWSSTGYYWDLIGSSTQARSIEFYEFKISRSEFLPMLKYLFRISFLTILDIYKAYFRGHHIREYKENICKRWPKPYSLWKKLLRLCALGFCNQVFLDLHCWWSEELCSQQFSSSWCVNHVLRVVHHWLVTYWDRCIKGWRSYIEEFRGSEAVEGFCCKFIFRKVSP